MGQFSLKASLSLLLKLANFIPYMGLKGLCPQTQVKLIPKTRDPQIGNNSGRSPGEPKKIATAQKTLLLLLTQ